MLRMYKNNGVFVYANNKMTDIRYSTDFDHETFTGNINVEYLNDSNNSEQIKFLNIPSLVKHYEREQITPEEFQTILSNKINESGCEYLYTQKDFEMGIFNCYCPIYGLDKNDIMSKIMNDEVFGDSIICLENNLNDDSRILSINSDLLTKILKYLSNTNHSNKNKVFCNIYYELCDM